MRTKNNPKARVRDIVVQDFKDEVLIYDLNIHKSFHLNQTSAMIWHLCDGNNTISDISRKLSNKLKSQVTDDLVWLALDQFKEDNLLANNEEVEIKFDGLSRREVMKKLGFATMITLPFITSIVAPKAAMAQSSCVSLGNPCASSASCCSSAPVCATSASAAGTCCAAGSPERRKAGDVVFGVIDPAEIPGTCATACNNSPDVQSICCSSSAIAVDCTPIDGTRVNTRCMCN